MKKFILMLALLAGLFTSCEKSDVIDDYTKDTEILEDIQEYEYTTRIQVEYTVYDYENLDKITVFDNRNKLSKQVMDYYKVKKSGTLRVDTTIHSYGEHNTVIDERIMMSVNHYNNYNFENNMSLKKFLTEELYMDRVIEGQGYVTNLAKARIVVAVKEVITHPNYPQYNSEHNYHSNGPAVYIIEPEIYKLSNMPLAVDPEDKTNLEYYLKYGIRLNRN